MSLLEVGGSNANTERNSACTLRVESGVIASTSLLPQVISSLRALKAMLVHLVLEIALKKKITGYILYGICDANVSWICHFFAWRFGWPPHSSGVTPWGYFPRSIFSRRCTKVYLNT